VFSIAQRLGGSLGIGVLASLLSARAAVVGPIGALHQIGYLLAAVAAVATALSLALPSGRGLARR
jgi:hypothetical protein